MDLNKYEKAIILSVLGNEICQNPKNETLQSAYQKVYKEWSRELQESEENQNDEEEFVEMYIHEAVMKAKRVDGYITRLEWQGQLRLKPTNTDNCCIIENKIDPPARGWQPSAEDLIANDWVVVTE